MHLSEGSTQHAETVLPSRVHASLVNCRGRTVEQTIADQRAATIGIGSSK
jgi:hypothetical protein